MLAGVHGRHDHIRQLNWRAIRSSFVALARVGVGGLLLSARGASDKQTSKLTRRLYHHSHRSIAICMPSKCISRQVQRTPIPSTRAAIQPLETTSIFALLKVFDKFRFRDASLRSLAGGRGADCV